MAVDIAISIVAKIGEYLVAPIGRQISYVLCYKNNIANLRSEVESLKIIRSDVQEDVRARKQNGDVIKSNVEKWLTTTSKIEEESSKFLADEASSNMWCFKGICPNLIRCYQQSRRATKKSAIMNTLSVEGRNFGDKVSHSAPPPTFASNSNEDVKDVLDSRKLMCEEVIEALKNDEINMIGIYGIGGIGKTTLVKQVGKQVQAEKLFDVVAIAIVSQTVDLRRMQGEIADFLGLKFQEESILGRAGRLSERIQRTKRILIILDDIWEKLELEDVGIPFGSNHRGCKILLTSRSMDVCNQMGSQRNIEIGVLSATESFTLFKKMAGDCMELVDIQPIAGEVVTECGGLPLAIVTVASALKGKSLMVWEDAATRLKNSILSDKVLSSLKLSYDYLHSDEAQSFFLLCCLFPEDFNILIQHLCRYGMGLRLFRDIENVRGARNRAHALSSNLKSSCLLLEGTNTYEVKMHDIVRDFAISTASKGEHVFLVKHAVKGKELPEHDVWQRYTSISLSSEDIVELPQELECPKLEILLLAFSNSSFEFPSNFFQKSTKLKVLSMQNMMFLQLPLSLKYLKNLETLCLDNSTLGDISVIGELTKLKILSFVWSEIKVLPKEIGNLANLRLLDLNECYQLERIAPGAIKGLSKLEELHMRNKFDGWEIGGQEIETNNASMEELKSVSQLTHLEIWIRDDKYFPADLVFTNLSSYHIYIGGKSFGEIDEYVPYSKRLDIIQSTSAISKDGVKELLKKCEYLDLSRMEGLPNILSDINRHVFLNLKSLSVRECSDVKLISKTMDNNLQVVFPVLEELILQGLEDLEEIWSDKFPEMFSSLLKNIYVLDLPNLLNISNQPSIFKHLEVVDVKSCDRLKSIFTHCMDRDFLKLLRLTIRECKMMEVVFEIKGEENAKIKEYVAFPNLETLKLEDLPNLTCLYSNMNTSTSLDTLFAEEQVIFPKLISLEIIKLPKFRNIWHTESNKIHGFQNLSELSISNCHNLRHILLEYVAFPNLERLMLEDLPNLTCFYSNMNTSTSLDTLFAEEQDSLTAMFPSSMLLMLHNLNYLRKSHCDSVEALFELKGLHETCLLPKLQSLNLENLPKLDRIFMDYVGPRQFLCFQNLRRVCIIECNNLRNLFTRAMAYSLVQLCLLEIRSCDLLDVIIVEDIEDDNSKDPIAFPRLTDVTLENLPNLSSFYNGNCSLFWPSLDFLKISDCPKMKGFISHSLSDQHILMRPLFDQQVSFSALTDLYISDMPSVEYLFSPFVAKSFKVLEGLYIVNCNKLEEIILGEGKGDDAMDHIEFPRLKRMTLQNLPHLESFYRGSCNFTCPKLNEMRVTKCPKMQKVSSGTISTPMLKSFELDNSRYDLKDDLNSIIQHLLATKGEPQSQTNIRRVEQ